MMGDAVPASGRGQTTQSLKPTIALRRRTVADLEMMKMEKGIWRVRNSGVNSDWLLEGSSPPETENY